MSMKDLCTYDLNYSWREKMAWKHLWFGYEQEASEENDAKNKVPINSTSKKTNLPKKCPTDIKEFVNSVKFELCGTEYRKVHPNLTLEERDALAELIAHQKSGSIGSSICILDRIDYENEARRQLCDTLVDEDDISRNY